MNIISCEFENKYITTFHQENAVSLLTLCCSPSILWIICHGVKPFPRWANFDTLKKLGFDFGSLRKVELNTSPNIKLVNVLALVISWRNRVELGMGIMWRVMMLMLMIQGRTPGDDAMLTNKSMTIKIIVVGHPTNGWWTWRLEYPWSSWSPTTQVLLLVVGSRTIVLLFVPIIIMA